MQFHLLMTTFVQSTKHLIQLIPRGVRMTRQVMKGLLRNVVASIGRNSLYSIVDIQYSTLRLLLCFFIVLHNCLDHSSCLSGKHYACRVSRSHMYTAIPYDVLEPDPALAYPVAAFLSSSKTAFHSSALRTS